jgi:hypothetical protein
MMTEPESEENSSDDSKNEPELAMIITLELVQLITKGNNVRGIMYSLNDSMKPVTENVGRDIIDCLKDFVKYIYKKMSIRIEDI